MFHIFLITIWLNLTASGEQPLVRPIECEPNRRCCSDQLHREFFLRVKFCNKGYEVRTDTYPLIVGKDYQSVNLLKTFPQRCLYDTRVDYQLSVHNTDILLGWFSEVSIQIVILPKYSPYLLLIKSANFVYVNSVLWGDIFPLCTKKRFWSVSYIQSGCRYSTMSL